MKKIVSILLLLATIIETQSAVAQQLFTSEFAPYDLREDAQKGKRTAKSQFIEFNPVVEAGTQELRYRQQIEVPTAWSDGYTMIHLNGMGRAYNIVVNQQLAAQNEDAYTPSTFDITPFIMQGTNIIEIEFRRSKYQQIDQGAAPHKTPQFEGSYIYSQKRLRIKDFHYEIAPDSTQKFGLLNLDLILENGFNFEETIDVGFDIYDPSGKLLEFDNRQVTIPGRSLDTLSLTKNIYGAYNYMWQAESQPATKKGVSKGTPHLFTLMLYRREGGILRDYIPLKVGFAQDSYDGETISRWGNPLRFKSTQLNALETKELTHSEMQKIKKSGKTLLLPQYPQPLWYYELAQEVGLYVIDAININAPQSSDNRSVGGTPSNDPELCDEYVRRAKSAYFRTRNFVCVVGYSLAGTPSGNGYNMYKAYQWLKSVETERPVIYSGANGEWNSDPLQNIE